MGLFDNLIKQVKGDINRGITKKVNQTVNGAINEAAKSFNRKTEKFTFASIPTSVEELKTYKEADLQSPFKTAALAMLVLLNYANNKEETFKMLDFLSGPEPLSPSEKAFIEERFRNAPYIAQSFFGGATVANNYTPNVPYTLTVFDNPYSYSDETYCKLFVTSAGADTERDIQLRKKPSTGQWFLVELHCLGTIRAAVKDNPWA